MISGSVMSASAGKSNSVGQSTAERRLHYQRHAA